MPIIGFADRTSKWQAWEAVRPEALPANCHLWGGDVVIERVPDGGQLGGADGPSTMDIALSKVTGLAMATESVPR